jgi:formylglycine-generating enzyme required for sulfatase activity
MVLIPGGEFAMGCHAETGETCGSAELPVHDVYVDSIYMTVYEVTNEYYCAVLNLAYALRMIDDPDLHGGVVYKAGDNEVYCDTTASSSYSRITWNGSTFGVIAGKEDHPMVRVSWFGAAAYANLLSRQRGRTLCYDLDTWECDFGANGFRLPTEAEWEYAARGGQHDPYYAYPWGNGIDGSKANYQDSGDPYETGDYPWTTPVGYYDGGQTPSGADMANGYGLYDMAGNAWEWCHDWWILDYYSSSPYDNPHGPVSGSYRALRGGAWNATDYYVRSANRSGWFEPDLCLRYVGFRVVMGR